MTKGELKLVRDAIVPWAEALEGVLAYTAPDDCNCNACEKARALLKGFQRITSEGGEG